MMFQSTPPHGRRRRSAQALATMAGFNPRLRTGGDPSGRTQTASAACFNPRLRTGGDQAVIAGPQPVHVSIHASAREATGPPGRPPAPCARFNPRLRTGGDWSRSPAPVVFMRFNPRLRTGGDPCQGAAAGPRSCFNPRLRTGGDDERLTIGRRLGIVSIHASAREATPHRYRAAGSPACFNPRLRTGGD